MRQKEVHLSITKPDPRDPTCWREIRKNSFPICRGGKQYHGRPAADRIVSSKMPSSTQPQDVRVRTPISSLQEKLEHMHVNETPARCRSPCCSTPLASSSSASQQPSSSSESTRRPALNRNTDTASSGRSMYSTGTDGSSYLQSEDGSAGFPDLGDNIDSTTFEQVINFHT